MRQYSILCSLILINICVLAQSEVVRKAYDQIPIVFSNIVPDNEGTLTFNSGKQVNKHPFYTLSNIQITPEGTTEGLLFDFKNEHFSGIIYYGLYSKELPKYPQVVYSKRKAKISAGRALVNISVLKGKYDIGGWEETVTSKLGYRIVNDFGRIIYDGQINIEGKGHFKVGLSIIEGPFVNKVSDQDATISFKTNKPCSPFVVVNNREYTAQNQMMNPMGDIYHEINVHHLIADSTYEYVVSYGNYSEKYHFKTAPKPGSRQAYVFAFASDSRAGQGGGERDIYGTNAYIMKKMAALAVKYEASFFQFTGDLINGYSHSIDETNLQFVNWKRNLQSFWHYMPFNVGFGNHEAVVTIFKDESKFGVQVDKFPFPTNSAERIFANNFVNPINGPESEDGAAYDPDLSKQNFPSYKENVFYYTHGNTAIVVLNSNYWYTPSTYKIPEIGGNPHGYIMDNQLKWLKQTIDLLENDSNVDHVFVTIHTPPFPNGGHSKDDMWYGGNNRVRPTVAGIPVEKGIIERRDEFLNIIINNSTKVVALLCGDEHNYSRLKISRKTPCYPDNHSGKKIKISRPIWQITNGSAGAPYYGQEDLPWSSYVKMFSTQYALNLIYIDGNTVKMKVINPDTLEEIENVVLK